MTGGAARSPGSTTLLWVIRLVYFGAVLFFAFRPFERLPYHLAKLVPGQAWIEDGSAIRMRDGGWAVENRAAAVEVASLVRGGGLAVELTLRCDHLDQGGPARILSFSRDAYHQVIMLGQTGSALVVRHGNDLQLVVPGVFEAGTQLSLRVVFADGLIEVRRNGERVARAVIRDPNPVAGIPSPVLLVGDEKSGGRIWAGDLFRLRIGAPATGAADTVAADFPGGHRAAAEAGRLPDNFAPVAYRPCVLSFRTGNVNRTDLLVNVLGFLPFAVLLVPRGRRFTGPALVPALATAFLASCAIEWTQRLLVGRDPNLADVAANLAGAVIGIVFCWFFSRRRLDLHNVGQSP